MKEVSYRIQHAKGTKGYYIDIYVGKRLHITKVATDTESMLETIRNLEVQFRMIGLKVVV